LTLKRWHRGWAFAVVWLLALIGVTSIEAQVQPADAANASRFDPGLIISDSVFYDFGTMSVDEIQRFLDSKVSKCLATTAPTCLKDYRTNTPAKPAEDGRCDAMPAKTDISAAQIIYDIAHACGINPRVLLVTLQKEQGLVQATNPTWYMYRAALGYGCPDSDPGICGKVWTGLFNQLHKGAGQFQWYGDPRGSFTYLKPGRTANIRYSPTASCLPKYKSVLIKSQATAALYYYTPYTPNDAALKNLYSTGDKCSAYGNRNFWRFFTDWFGSTIGGGFLLQSNAGVPYLVVDDTRYRIDEPALVNALSPLGPLGTISTEYLDSFKEGQVLNRLVKSTTGKYYFIEGGLKYPVASCELATTLGLNCATAVQLTSSQLSAISTGAAMSALVMGSTADTATDRYLLIDGVKHEILDDASLAAANLTLPAKAPVAITAFASLPWGAPIAKENSLFVNRTTGQKEILFAGHIYSIDSATAVDVDFAKWFTASAGTLSADSARALETGITIKGIVADENAHYYLLNSLGKQALNNGETVVAGAPVIPAALLNRVPTVGQAITAPFFASATASKVVFLIRDLKRRPTVSATDRAKFTSILATPILVALNNSAMAQIVSAPTLLGPGNLLKIKSSDTLYFIDASDRAFRFVNSSHAKLFTSAKPKLVSKALLSGYTTKSAIGGFRVRCDGVEYFAIDGKLHPVLAEYAIQFPGKVFTLDSLTCATLSKSTTGIGRFIVEGTGPSAKYFLLQGKKKRLVASKKQYLLIRGATPAALPVSSYFASLLPTGSALAASVKTVLAGPTVSPTPAPSVSPSAPPPSLPVVTPSPTPTTPATPKANVTYRIKSGDSLSSIAARFKVTLTALAAANRITNVNRISVGQVLVIP